MLNETGIIVTLEAARVNCGYNLIQAAERLGIHRDTLWKYEQDSTNVPRTFMLKVETVYGYPIDNIFFGIKSDFFRIKQDADKSKEGEGNGNETCINQASGKDF